MSVHVDDHITMPEIEIVISLLMETDIHLAVNMQLSTKIKI